MLKPRPKVKPALQTKRPVYQPVAKRRKVIPEKMRDDDGISMQGSDYEENDDFVKDEKDYGSVDDGDGSDHATLSEYGECVVSGDDKFGSRQKDELSEWSCDVDEGQDKLGSCQEDELSELSGDVDEDKCWFTECKSDKDHEGATEDESTRSSKASPIKKKTTAPPPLRGSILFCVNPRTPSPARPSRTPRG